MAIESVATPAPPPRLARNFFAERVRGRKPHCLWYGTSEPQNNWRAAGSTGRRGVCRVRTAERRTEGREQPKQRAFVVYWLLCRWGSGDRYTLVITRERGASRGVNA